jgi:hypothetical protein
VRVSRISLFVLLGTFAAVGQIPQQNWFPQAIENLGQYASSRTEFSFDHSMLVMASKVDQDDDSLRRVIAGVDGISVHRFRFQGAGMYDPQILNAVRQEYRSAGWQHVSSAHDKYGYPSGADLWLRLDHNAIRNIAVLLAGGSQVNFIAVSGSISPLDLLHLAGHFGIPRIDGGVAVPRRGAAGSGPDEGAYPPDSSTPPETRPAPVPGPQNQEPDYRHPNPEPRANRPEPN